MPCILIHMLTGLLHEMPEEDPPGGRLLDQRALSPNGGIAVVITVEGFYSPASLNTQCQLHL